MYNKMAQKKQIVKYCIKIFKILKYLFWMNETEEYFLCDKNIENASYSSSKKRDCEINFHVKYSSFFWLSL